MTKSLAGETALNDFNFLTLQEYNTRTSKYNYDQNFDNIDNAFVQL